MESDGYFTCANLNLMSNQSWALNVLSVFKYCCCLFSKMTPATWNHMLQILRSFFFFFCAAGRQWVILC